MASLLIRDSPEDAFGRLIPGSPYLPSAASQPLEVAWRRFQRGLAIGLLRERRAQAHRRERCRRCTAPAIAVEDQTVTRRKMHFRSVTRVQRFGTGERLPATRADRGGDPIAIKSVPPALKLAPSKPFGLGFGVAAKPLPDLQLFSVESGPLRDVPCSLAKGRRVELSCLIG